MRKVIDLECDLPPDESGNPRKLEEATHPPGYGDPERLAPLPGTDSPTISASSPGAPTARQPPRPPRSTACRSAISSR